MSGVWLAIPVKATAGAKQRLAAALPASQRPALALAMLEDVLSAATAATGLAGILLVTVDPAAVTLGRRYGARILSEGAEAGHTAAVAAASRLLEKEGRAGMLTLPGDIPLVSPEEISRLIAGHGAAPAFSIVPSHDLLGSNAVLCSPPGAVTLRFGDDSFYPHLDAARRAGIEPRVERLPGIALDIDEPKDLARFLAMPSRTRAYELLLRQGARETAS